MHILAWAFADPLGHLHFVLGLMLNTPVNSYGHVGMVKSLNHPYFLGKLEKAGNQYLVGII